MTEAEQNRTLTRRPRLSSRRFCLPKVCLTPFVIVGAFFGVNMNIYSSFVFCFSRHWCVFSAPASFCTNTCLDLHNVGFSSPYRSIGV